MHKLPAVLLLGILSCLATAPKTWADEITYTVDGTYGTGTFATGFTITFSVPSTLTGSFSLDSVDVVTTATYTSLGTSVFEPAGVVFFDTALGGLFDIDLGFTGQFVVSGSRQIGCLFPCELSTFGIWEFFGPQIFAENGSGTQVTFLTSGSPFPITPGPSDGSGSFFFIPDSPVSATIAGGSVATTPEPPSLLLLGAGLMGLSVIGRTLRRRAQTSLIRGFNP